jgi:hypothetical protein
MPSRAGVEAGDEPFTSGSFKIQSALSATHSHTWAILQPSEMKGDLRYHLSRPESACWSITVVL